MDGLYILQAEGPDAFSQFHLYVCSAFLVRWSEKLREMDFQVRRSSSHRAKPNPVSHVAALLSNPTRASLCSCSRCRHKIGRTTKSRCSSAKRSCSIRSGTTRRATSLESEIESVFHFSIKPFPTSAPSLGCKWRRPTAHNSRASAIKLR